MFLAPLPLPSWEDARKKVRNKERDYPGFLTCQLASLSTVGLTQHKRCGALCWMVKFCSEVKGERENLFCCVAPFWPCAPSAGNHITASAGERRRNLRQKQLMQFHPCAFWSPGNFSWYGFRQCCLNVAQETVWCWFRLWVTSQKQCYISAAQPRVLHPFPLHSKKKKKQTRKVSVEEQLKSSAMWQQRWHFLTSKALGKRTRRIRWLKGLPCLSLWLSCSCCTARGSHAGAQPLGWQPR